MDNRFDHLSVEHRIADAWEQAKAFRAGRVTGDPFCVMIPPPNVTGSLHMGHALNTTLQDILCRFERMRGRDVLWQPGTDHAGIATQMVVERKLAAKGDDRRKMGREKFLKEVWDWKEESGGQIVEQLKRLGASCDWSRLTFTMGEKGAPDEQMMQAVTKVFVDLYNKGLIYKDKRLVNWDPHFETAISDLEVVQVEKRGSFKWERGEGQEEGELDVAALEKVLNKDPHGHMYYINYPLSGVDYNPDDKATFITVATTRPETMLGDVTVAVHPEDERYQHLIGKELVLPIVGRLIPIIADTYSDPEKGTGAVKITPAHDENDYEVWKRHPGLDFEIILNGKAHIYMQWVATLNLMDATPDGYTEDNQPIWSERGPDFKPSVSPELSGLQGLDRYKARQAIIALLSEKNLLVKIEPITHMVPHGDRSGVAIEPLPTDQWYVNVQPLADKALDVVRQGKTRFIPQNWEKTYFQWLENIQPWCISRQLWWGHQVPVWYGLKIIDKTETGFTTRFNGEDFQKIVAVSEAEAIKQAKQIYGVDRIVIVDDGNAVLDHQINQQIAIFRDPDVLDTWFSSALWPFSTLGWQGLHKNTPELARYYPTSVLVTGFDIIFFWVARMMMMGLEFMDDVPFRDVYIHPLVRDERGAKMSKSKGNVIDPLDLITTYGADALRFTLASQAAQGRDIKLSTARVESTRNFTTKIWNAARFAEMNGCTRDPAFNPANARETLNQWCLAECTKAIAEVTQNLEAYRFNDAANAAYRFVWNIFCDWYVELSKPVLQAEDEAGKHETRATTAFVFDQICHLLHPFMPFITEELWRERGGEGLLCLSPWPKLEGLNFPQAEEEVSFVLALISDIRSSRSETNVPASAQIPLLLVNPSRVAQERVERWHITLKRLARLSDIQYVSTPPKGALQLLVHGLSAALPVADLVDLAAERTRLSKDIAKLEGDIAKIDAKLSNADFRARAPEEVLQDNEERKTEALERKAKMLEGLKRLEDAG